MKNELMQVSEVGGFQGDVGLVRVPDELAEKLKNSMRPRKGKEKNILAFGEETGHNHRS